MRGFGNDEPGTSNFWLGLDASGELREQFSREVAGIGWVDGALAAKIVVEDPAIGGFMDMGEGEIHMVPFNGAGDAADEDDGAVLVLPLDDSDVRQRVVHLAVSVEVPGVVEKYEVAWMDCGALVERALLAYVGMDDPDPVGVTGAGSALIEIDSVFEINGASDSGAVVGDAAAIHVDGTGADELRGGADDGRLTGRRLHRLAAFLAVQRDPLRAISGDAGTAD